MARGARWSVTIAASLATFGLCWAGLACRRVLDTGSQIGLAAVPFARVVAVLGSWAEYHRTGERSATEANTAGQEDVLSAPTGRTSGAVPPPPMPSHIVSAHANTVKFGPYRWRVPTTDGDGRRLLLCEDVVREGPYHSDGFSVTWEKSDLRRWLNGRPSKISRGVRGREQWEQWAVPTEAYLHYGDEHRWMTRGDKQRFWPSSCFLEAFRRDEVRRIESVFVATEDEGWTAARVADYMADMKERHPQLVSAVPPSELARNWKKYWSDKRWEVKSDHETRPVPGGVGVNCRVFLLSAQEVEDLLPAVDLEKRKGVWWLRSPGVLPFCVSAVNNGVLDRLGIVADDPWSGIRPALWLNPPQA